MACRTKLLINVTGDRDAGETLCDVWQLARSAVPMANGIRVLVEAFEEISERLMVDAQTRDAAGSHVVACMRPWTIAPPSWILRPFIVSKGAIR